MRTLPRPQPVHRRHVRAMLAVLALGTWALITPLDSSDAHGLWDTAEPLLVGLVVTATFFLPTLRLACTQRGSWIALRRAQGHLRDFGLCVGLLCMLLLIIILSNAHSVSPHVAETAFDVCFDGMVDGATLYLWGLAALPVLHGVVWAESAWKGRDAR
ncbi:hypothetical protein G3N57_00290 [Paraburkholderia sp. Se-20369]|nr:hypothetical protein [Paraburkholderia sp. Se-20369]